MITVKFMPTNTEDDDDKTGRDPSLVLYVDRRITKTTSTKINNLDENWSGLFDRQETVDYFTDVHHVDPFQAFAKQAK